MSSQKSQIDTVRDLDAAARELDRLQRLANLCREWVFSMTIFTSPKFQIGDRVRKTKGASWQGKICGYYTTSLTPEGYAVESERESGSVQIYPAAALEFGGGATQ